MQLSQQHEVCMYPGDQYVFFDIPSLEMLLTSTCRLRVRVIVFRTLDRVVMAKIVMNFQVPRALKTRIGIDLQEVSVERLELRQFH